MNPYLTQHKAFLSRFPILILEIPPIGNHSKKMKITKPLHEHRCADTNLTGCGTCTGVDSEFQFQIKLCAEMWFTTVMELLDTVPRKQSVKSTSMLKVE